MAVIATTGYFATGSGAVYNLLQEYDSVTDGGLTSFEHIFLYDINGVFETINKIRYANGFHNSNAAINQFRREMTKLSKKNFGWFGGYHDKCGDKFLEIIEEFIQDITEFKIEQEWYGTFENRVFSFERFFKDSASILLKRKSFDSTFATRIKQDSFNKGEFSFASEEKLQQACRKLVRNYIKLLYPEVDRKNVILNHMVQPHYAYMINEYMPEDFKLIIVDRDIRDIYTYNTHTDLWGGKRFPTDIDEFISFTKKYRLTERKTSSNQILRLQFEDLIYHYEETVARIEAFTGIDSKYHSRVKEIFDPGKSIKNTQLFAAKPKWKEEARLIANALPELVYHFPYQFDTSVNEIFDA